MISYAMRVTKMYSLLGLEMLKVKITLGTLCVQFINFIVKQSKFILL